MIEIGEVIKVEEDRVEVFFQSSEYCEKCKICYSDSSGRRTLILYNPVGAKVKDKVEVFIPEGMISKVSFSIFIFPLLIFFSAYWILWKLTDSELMSSIGGMVAFLLAFYALRLYEKKIAEIKRVTLPCILKIHKPP